jgi:imidazolonepropionase-like amidohydrolase
MNRSRFFAFAVFAAMLGAVSARASEDAVSEGAKVEVAPGPAAPQAPLVIRGAMVHPVVGPELPDATVLVESGKITAVGTDVQVPRDAQVVDATGLHLYPGLIDGDTALGLVEIPTVRGSVDLQETGRVNPDIIAEVAINPSSHLIGVARAGGVTSVLVVPQADLFGGYAALVDLSGWTWEEMLRKSHVGLHLVFPTIPSPPPWEPQKSDEEKKKDRDKKLKDLNRVFDDAEAYLKAQAGLAGHADREPPRPELRLEALAPVIRGELPIIVTASDLPTIKAAVEWAEKRKLKIVLRGAADAWRWADELAKRKIPVLLQDPLTLPQREDEPYDAAFSAAKVLHEAGVLFCITGSGESALVGNLPYRAAMAAAYGLPEKAAIEAITIAPARIFGVDAQIGSIEVGKDANLILTDGDPLEIRTHLVSEWIRGRPVDLRDKHVQIYELWKSRPPRP